MKATNAGNVISKVNHGSIAEEVGIEPGDILMSINGNPIEDIIEYQFYLCDEYLEVEIRKKNGENWIIEIEKEYDEDLGIEFTNPIIDEAKYCKNKCIFCFIDQLPPNMRKSLYFKDDDSRLSFLQGNYVSLTNMGSEEINKIIKYRISPINISVHTTNGELRKKMMGNPRAAHIMNILEKFAVHGIQMNCQIVLCPEVNDGNELDNTIRDLERLGKCIRSVAVVPVGLTAYREGLVKLKTFTKTTAMETIKQVQQWQRFFQKKWGRNFVYLSDEFYFLAEEPFPDYISYDHFPQLENGVGMVVKFKKEFYDAFNRLAVPMKISQNVTVVTGTLACNFIKELCRDLMNLVQQLQINVVCVKNHFFGGGVSVSGLVTGSDLIQTLRDMPLGDRIVIPQSMLKADEEVFLDNLSVKDVSERLGIPIQVCEVNGEAFINTILIDNY